MPASTRRVAIVIAFAGLLALSGCIGQFGVGIPNEDLAQNASYEWNRSATVEDWPDNVTVQVEIKQGGLLGGDAYRAIYTGNRTRLTFSERGFTRSHAVDIRAVKYQYPNGTVVGHEHVEVSQNARRTEVILPEGPGRFAWTGDRRNKELRLPAVADGNYTVTLPRNYRVGDILLSDVSPGGYDTERRDGHMIVRWEGVDASDALLVRFYHDRDWYLFYGLIALLSLLGAGIYLYYQREIRKIQEWRAAQGLDIDTDDDGKEPPPGMG